jgi:hypothetical protein
MYYVPGKGGAPPMLRAETDRPPPPQTKPKPDSVPKRQRVARRVPTVLNHMTTGLLSWILNKWSRSTFIILATKT